VSEHMCVGLDVDKRPDCECAHCVHVREIKAIWEAKARAEGVTKGRREFAEEVLRFIDRDEHATAVLAGLSIWLLKRKAEEAGGMSKDMKFQETQCGEGGGRCGGE